MTSEKHKNPHTRLTNTEIVTLAVYLAGGSSRSVDTEDIAVKTNELAPGRFAWRKYKDQINLDAVRKRLWDAKKQFAYISGSESDGWMLTPEGQSMARSRARCLPGVELSRRSTNENEKRWRRRERSRLIACEAFAKYQQGAVTAITIAEAESFFRIDEYVTGEHRERTISRLVNAFRNDPDIAPAMSAILSVIRNRSGNDV